MPAFEYAIFTLSTYTTGAVGSPSTTEMNVWLADGTQQTFKTPDFQFPLLSGLNSLGAQGWEFIGNYDSPGYGLLKRQK